jgi:MoaA/NifB/PqqE/SkfB family radical SAM enzyme
MTSAELEGAADGAKRDRRSASPGANPHFDTLWPVFNSGGPGFCQFALNNACNANCDFCNFARDSLPKSQWKFVDRQGAFDAMDIMHRRGIRYLLFTGGEQRCIRT